MLKGSLPVLRSVCALLLACTVWGGPVIASENQPIRVASKNFAENYLLAEVIAQLLESQGLAVERAFGLGGTLICYQALLNDEIDLYVEYTGTLSQAILQTPDVTEHAELNALIAERGLQLLPELGFNNTYAIAVREQQATDLGLESIGDLARYPQLKLVFSHEFLQRSDGWPGLSQRYGLTQSVQGIEHALAYQAIADGAIDATDAYSTDGELSRYQLQVLVDDLNYFPAYMAAPLARSAWVQQAPQAAQMIGRLAGLLDAQSMRRLNAEVAVKGKSYAEVASEFLSAHSQALSMGLVEAKPPSRGIWSETLGHVLRHLQLTGLALGAAIVLGLALSLTIFSKPKVANAVVYFCGLCRPCHHSHCWL